MYVALKTKLGKHKVNLADLKITYILHTYKNYLHILRVTANKCDNFLSVPIALFPFDKLSKGCAPKTFHLHSCTETSLHVLNE